jgi:DNA primase
MLSNHNIDGSMSAYCFRCGKIGYKHAGELTLQDRARNKQLTLEAHQHAINTHITLPSDTTFSMVGWSPEARLWCYKAGIYGQQTDVGYSPRLNRCVLPVRETGSQSLIFYQLRKLSGDGPKYISPSIDRSSIMYFKKPDRDGLCGTGRTRTCATRQGQRGVANTSAVIVEDILSAIRVGAHTDTFSLLGTSLSIENADKLSKYDSIYTWLDGDAGGLKGVAQVHRLLGLTTDCYNIQTELDPKHYSASEIKSILLKAGVC